MTWEMENRLDQSKDSILFILHMPPPVHGAAMIGQYIQQSKEINNSFNCDFINLSTTRDLSEMKLRRTGKVISFLKSGKFFSILKLYGKVVSAVARKKYRLCYLTINSHGNAVFKEIIIIIILKISGCKLIYHFHNKGLSESRVNWLIHWLYMYQFRNSRVILLSPLLYHDIKKYVFPSRVYYCANGIPDNDIEPDNIVRTTTKHCPEILFLSNMMKEKGVFVLLEACRLLRQRGQVFKAILAGAWADISEVEFFSYVSANGLSENVEYHGAVYNDEKENIFSRADIFVHPTLNDCFPLVIIEAMQHGLPVISSDDGGIPDIIEDNYNGFLVPKGDPEALARKVMDLLKDPYLRIEMGNRGRRKFLEKYSMNHFEKRFVNVLNQINAELC